MSRSYKKIPCCKDFNRGMKKRANRHVRRYFMYIPSGGAYKKIFCSYNICDYKFLRSFDAYKKEWFKYKRNRKRSDDELYKMWYRDYKMK